MVTSSSKQLIWEDSVEWIKRIGVQIVAEDVKESFRIPEESSTV